MTQDFFNLILLTYVFQILNKERKRKGETVSHSNAAFPEPSLGLSCMTVIYDPASAVSYRVPSGPGLESEAQPSWCGSRAWGGWVMTDCK